MHYTDQLHLLSRAAYGWHPNDDALLLLDRQELIKELLQRPAPAPLRVLAHPLAGKRRDEVSNLQLLLSILTSQRDLELLNVAWLKRMVTTAHPLHEKMCLFWHNHFATRSPFAYLAQVQHNTIDAHATGNFRSLLHAMAKDPAMILFLNNQQNVKDHPNENFAREVMELFTLGEGHYSETDIKEAARCFTGWQVNRQANFEKVAAVHDNGVKTVLGHTGAFDGEEVIDLLLDNKQTAYHIASKFWKAFVHPDPLPEDITVIAEAFYASDYDIKTLIREVFSRDAFYKSDNQGMLIASPVELLVRHSRLLNINWKDDKQIVKLQHVLGQVLFYPPNVAGWPGGRHWIDGSTLLIRSNLPLQYWQAYTGKNRKLAKKIDVQPEWITVDDSLEKQLDHWLLHILPVPIPKADQSALLSQSRRQKEPAIAALLSLLTLPEAQLI